MQVRRSFSMFGSMHEVRGEERGRGKEGKGGEGREGGEGGGGGRRSGKRVRGEGTGVEGVQACGEEMGAGGREGGG